MQIFSKLQNNMRSSLKGLCLDLYITPVQFRFFVQTQGQNNFCDWKFNEQQNEILFCKLSTHLPNQGRIQSFEVSGCRAEQRLIEQAVMF